MRNCNCVSILTVLFASLSHIALPDSPWTLMDSAKISDWDSRITYIPSPSEPEDCFSPSKEEDSICACRWRSMYDAAANISLHTTCGPDTALELSFVGSELQLWGSTSSEGALAYATIDNDTSTAATVTFTSTDGQTHNNVLLLDIAGLDLDPSHDHRLRLQYDSDIASYWKQTKKRRYIFVDWFVVTQMTEDKGSLKGSPNSAGGSTIQPPAPPPPPHTTSDISTRSMSEVLFSGTKDSHTDVEVSSVLVVSGTTLTVTATVDVIAISSASASHSSDGRASRSFSLTRHDTSSTSSYSISDSSSATAGDPAPSNHHDGLADRKTIAIAISLSIIAFAVLSLLLVLFLRRRGRHPSRSRLRARSTGSSTHASSGTRVTTFDTTIRPFTLASSPPQRRKTSTCDHWEPALQVPGRYTAGHVHDEPRPPRPSIDSARTRVAV